MDMYYHEYLQEFKPLDYRPKHRNLNYIPETVQNIPYELDEYRPQIAKIIGSTNKAVWGNIVAFGVGFSSLAVFAPTLKQMTMLKSSEKMLIAASPALAGSLARIPFGFQVARTGGTRLADEALIISCIGMLLNVAFIFNQDLHTIEGGSAEYYGWCFSGVLCGAGISIFPLTTNVLYWSQRKDSGHNQAMFGGLGNITPGVFLVILAFLVKIMELKSIYVIWIIGQILMTVISIEMLYADPYHQLLLHGICWQDSKKIARWIGQTYIANYWKDGHPPICPLLTSGYVIVLIINYFVGMGGFLAMASFLPNYMDVYHHAEETPILLATGSFLILASVTRSCAGGLTDKLGGGNSCIFGYLIAGTGSTFVGLCPMDAPYHFLNIVGLGMLAMGTGIVNAGTYKWIPELCAHAAGPVGGLVGGLGSFGGFVIPQLLGIIIAWGDEYYAKSVLIFTGFSVVMIVLNILLEIYQVTHPNDESLHEVHAHLEKLTPAPKRRANTTQFVRKSQFNIRNSPQYNGSMNPSNPSKNASTINEKALYSPQLGGQQRQFQSLPQLPERNGNMQIVNAGQIEIVGIPDKLDLDQSSIVQQEELPNLDD